MPGCRSRPHTGWSPSSWDGVRSRAATTAPTRWGTGCGPSALLAPVQGELREVAAPFLQDLYAATGDTVHLAVREGNRALYVERLSGKASVPVVSQVGGRLPLHTTGVGKVLLAHAPPDVVRQVLGSPDPRDAPLRGPAGPDGHGSSARSAVVATPAPWRR